MPRIYGKQQWASFIFFIMALIPGISMEIRAQDSSLELIQTAEYDIGLDCPVATALDPTETRIWVLMDGCHLGRYSLHVYDVHDGTRLNEDDYAAALQSLEGGYIDSFVTPLGFTPAGDLSIRYSDAETYESYNLLIPLASGGEPEVQYSASYNALLSSITDYPEYSVYSPDHTRVVVTAASSFHVLDVQAESEIAEIPVEGSTDSYLAAFSADSAHLHVVQFAEDDISGTLFIYDLPAGDLLRQYDLPSSAVWLSPDEQYAAMNLFSFNIGDQNELLVMNLETGLSSPASNLDEDPAPVTTCLNTGNDVSDVDFMTSGRFSFPAVHWLSDNATILLALSYGGEGARGGTPCIFNFSRLRSYHVEATG